RAGEFLLGLKRAGELSVLVRGHGLPDEAADRYERRRLGYLDQWETASHGRGDEWCRNGRVGHPDSEAQTGHSGADQTVDVLAHVGTVGLSRRRTRSEP